MNEPKDTIVQGIAYDVGRFTFMAGWSGQIFAIGFILPENAVFFHVGPFNVGVCWR